MKLLPVASVLLLACALAPAFAQEIPLEPSPATRTGDAWVDRQLDDINRYGARYRDAFVDELVRYHRAPRQFVLDLLDRGWPPGDIYYACALGSVAGRPCRHVVDQYAGGDGPDWHAVAQRIGVEVGSPQYRRVKQGLAATYGRWGRPIEVETVAHDEPVPRGAPVEPAAPSTAAAASGLPVAPPRGKPEADAKRQVVSKQKRPSASVRDD